MIKKLLLTLLCWAAIAGSACAQDYTSNLAIRWTLDDTSGTTATDSSGASRHGTYANTPTLNVAGKNGTAVDFDGTNEYVDRADHYNGVTILTVAIWVYPDVVNTTKWAAIKMNTTGLGSDAHEYRLGVNSSGNPVFVARNSSDTGNCVSLTSSTTLVAGTWYHLVGTVPGNGLTAKLYVNGASTASASQSGNIQDTESRIQLAARVFDDDATFWNGKLDDFRLYTGRALSDADVSALYAAMGGSSGSIVPLLFQRLNLMGMIDRRQLTPIWKIQLKEQYNASRNTTRHRDCAACFGLSP